MVNNLGRRFLKIILSVQLFVWVTPAIDASEIEWVSSGDCKSMQGDVSPDGKLLAYVRECSRERSVWVKYLQDQGDGVPVRSIQGEIADPSFTPDSQSLVFSRKVDGVYKVFRQGLRSNNEPEQLTFGSGNDHHPKISPDGRKLAFDSDRSGNFDIWVLDLGSKSARQLTQWDKPDFDPSWDAASSRILYTSLRAGAFNLFVKNMQIPQSLPVQLTQEEGAASHGVFATDTRGVVFERTHEGKSSLRWISLDTYSQFEIAEGACRPSRPRVAQNWLAYECEASGVFGLRRQKLPAKPSESLKPAKSSEVRALDVVAQAPKVEKAPDFEKELSRIEDAKEGSKKEKSDFFSDFEGYDFDLSFLSEKPEASRPLMMAEGGSLPEGTPKVETLVDDTPAILAPPAVVSEEAELAQALEKAVEGQKDESFAPVVESPKPALGKFDEWIQPVAARVELPVAATIPQNGASQVQVFTPISIILSASPGGHAQELLSPKLYENGREIPAQSQWHQAQNRVDIFPQEGLKPGSEYQVVAGAFEYSFQTEGQAPASSPVMSVAKPASENRLVTPLRIARAFPNHRSRNVKVNTPVHVTFNQKIDVASLNAGSLRLYADGQQVPGEMVFEEGDTMLTLRPYRNLAEATVYEVRLDSGLLSADGQPIDGPSRLQFKTQYFSPFMIQEFPPQVLDHSTQPIVFLFNRPVHPQSLKAEDFFLKNGNFSYRGQVELSQNRRAIRFVPYQRLPDGQDFVFYVSAALKDEDGNVLNNGRPVPMSTRFGGGAASRPLMANARPLSTDSHALQVGEEDLMVLQNWKERGFLSGRSLDAVLGGQERPTRYRVAQLLEEALMNSEGLLEKERQELFSFAMRYDTELRNLGLDWRNFTKPRTNSQTSRRSMRTGDVKSGDFESRARQL